MKKIYGLIISVILITFGTQSMAGWQEAIVTDHYNEKVYLEPYTVEVCSNEQIYVGSQADIINGAIWGTIFGAVIGDAIDDENGKLPGAIIGAAIGSNEANNNSNTTAMVCQTETRKTSTLRNEYSHSTIRFDYEGSYYEIDFIKR